MARRSGKTQFHSHTHPPSLALLHHGESISRGAQREPEVHKYSGNSSGTLPHLPAAGPKMRGRAGQGLFTLVHPPEQEGGAPVAAVSCLWSQIAAVRISPAAEPQLHPSEAHGINPHPRHSELQLCSTSAPWRAGQTTRRLQALAIFALVRGPFNHSAPQTGEETGASAVVY